MYNKIDLREVPAERLKEISLDLVDIDVKAPEFEPNSSISWRKPGTT